MSIDVEEFSMYVVLGVAAIALIWALWPLVFKKKVVEPIVEEAPAPAPVAETAPPAPEPVVEAAPVVVETPAPKKAPAKKISSKKAPTPAPKKAPAVKTKKKG